MSMADSIKPKINNISVCAEWLHDQTGCDEPGFRNVYVLLCEYREMIISLAHTVDNEDVDSGIYSGSSPEYIDGHEEAVQTIRIILGKP